MLQNPHTILSRQPGRLPYTTPAGLPFPDPPGERGLGEALPFRNRCPCGIICIEDNPFCKREESNIKHITNKVKKTIHDWEMIAADDRIAVGLSERKDSSI